MGKNASVLIVDDMPEHIAFAGTILKNEGYTVYAASSGQAALDFLESKVPDLIVLDINMQGLTGFEVCNVIKSNPRTRNIPVIFLTSENSPKMIKQGFELGCCDYVQKPFVKEEYLARVNAHIKISRHHMELENAYAELNIFCSAVSHDLKSPLNIITMLTDAIKQENGDTDNEIFKISEMISDKSQKMVEMVERLLEFSKMCNIKPMVEELDLNIMFKEIFNELKEVEQDREITLIPSDIPIVKGDKILVRVMLKNIMSNAFKFTQYKNTAVISLKSYYEDGYTVVSVKDNGAGFDMKYSEKLFAIFQRLHEQEDFNGSGVGLAMIDRIIKRHGGKVSIKGEIDNGAEVLLYFK